MSGVAVIRGLLAANSALVAVVPASKIMAGVIPLGTALPAISLAQISGMARQSISRTQAKRYCTDRVQVTVMAKTYGQQKQVLALVQAACPNTRGTVNAVACESVIDDAVGPDVFDAEANLYFQSQDYLVSYHR